MPRCRTASVPSRIGSNAGRTGRPQALPDGIHARTGGQGKVTGMNFRDTEREAAFALPGASEVVIVATKGIRNIPRRMMRNSTMQRSAVFSPCRKFRYSLSRAWDCDLSTVMFVGLNPSTADDQRDDPTVRRCIGFARDWGFGSLVLVNLFAYRATNPSDLLLVANPIGPANDASILKNLKSAARIVVAWGIHGSYLDRDQHVLSLLPQADCFGVTQNGAPRHPLYLASKTRLRPYSIDSVDPQSPLCEIVQRPSSRKSA